VGIGEQMVFAAQFAPIRGIWAGFVASAGSPQRGAIHQSALPIDLVGCLEFREQEFEKALPNPCLLPLPKVAQAGVSRGKIARGRKATPRDTRPQDEEDAGNDLSEVTGLSSRKLNMTILPGLGKQRFQAFPKVVGQNRFGHEKDLLSRSSSDTSWQHAKRTQKTVNFATGS
jgi:hypothetical protein